MKRKTGKPLVLKQPLYCDNLNLLQVQVDKENSMEFLLDFLYYLYNYYIVCALLFYTYHMTSCDVTHDFLLCDYDL